MIKILAFLLFSSLLGKNLLLNNIKISSTRAYFSFDKKEMDFENNVQLIDGKLVLSCFRLKIIFGKQEKIKKILCYEKVKIITENATAQGEILEYFPATQRLELSKSAKLVYIAKNGEKSRYEAEKIIFFKNTDVINILKPKSTISLDKNAK